MPHGSCIAEATEPLPCIRGFVELQAVLAHAVYQMMDDLLLNIASELSYRFLPGLLLMASEVVGFPQRFLVYDLSLIHI